MSDLVGNQNVSLLKTRLICIFPESVTTTLVGAVMVVGLAITSTPTICARDASFASTDLVTR